jgi:hypothetical protein
MVPLSRVRWELDRHGEWPGSGVRLPRLRHIVVIARVAHSEVVRARLQPESRSFSLGGRLDFIVKVNNT